MSGTRYPLNLAEMCWKLELRKPELIEEMYNDNKTLKLEIKRLTDELNNAKKEEQSKINVDDNYDESFLGALLG